MTDRKEVGNLELGTNLEFDNLEARTESGVDKDPEEYTESGVDLGVCTVFEVDNLEVCTVLEVVLQNNIVLQFFLGKNYPVVAPQAVIDCLEFDPQVVTDCLEVAPQAVIDFPEIALQAVNDFLEVADLEYYQTS